jgi:hypothetical protein
MRVLFLLDSGRGRVPLVLPPVRFTSLLERFVSMQSDPRRTDGAVQRRILPEGDFVLGNGFDVEESGGGLAHDEVLSGDEAARGCQLSEGFA